MQANKKDIFILHIETSTKACSVALSKNEECIGKKEYLGQNFSHAEKLPLFIEEIIQESKLSKSDLNAIAISSGPGSYTGLRIGCSTAKGLCFALNIPLISVDSLQIPTQLNPDDELKNKTYISLMKARMNEVFIGHFEGNISMKETYFQDIDEQSFKEFAQKQICFVGNGIDLMEDNINTNSLWTTCSLDNPYSSVGMVALAYTKYCNSDFEDLAYYEPFYLKDFIVLKKKNK